MDARTAVLITTEGYAESAHLIAELDADLSVRYGGGDAVVASAAQFQPAAGGRFHVAWVNGVEAGCAGIRREGQGVAELKRMWVRPTYRGLGIARALLAACEESARDLGYAELWLETGTKQPEAIALYASSGYVPVASFGQWACAPDSIHLGRRLTA